MIFFSKFDVSQTVKFQEGSILRNFFLPMDSSFLIFQNNYVQVFFNWIAWGLKWYSILQKKLLLGFSFLLRKEESAFDLLIDKLYRKHYIKYYCQWIRVIIMSKVFFSQIYTSGKFFLQIKIYSMFILFIVQPITRI